MSTENEGDQIAAGLTSAVVNEDGTQTQTGGEKVIVSNVPQNQVMSQTLEFKNSSFPEFLCLLPTFSGTDEEFTLKDFFEKVDEVADLEGWGEKHYVTAVKWKLVGEAATFAKSHPAVKEAKTKVQIKTELENRFGKLDDGDKLIKLTQATQKPNEKTRSFLSRLSGLAHKCFPTEEVMREKFLFNQSLKGLNISSRRFIMSQKPKTSKDIWEAAIEEEKCLGYDKFNAEINVAAGTSTTDTNSDIAQIKQLLQYNISDTDKKIQELTEQVQNLTAIVSSRKETPPQTTPPNFCPQQQYMPQYQYYPQYPHQQRNFRNDIICYSCGNPGHISRFCKNKKQGNNSKNQNLN